MAGEFSGAVKLTDINDFIAPSQSCVVGIGAKKVDTSNGTEGAGEVSIQRRSRRGNDGPGTDVNSPAVKVTLHDCLACSGCVTSAETIILEQQSGDEFLSKLRDTSMAVVVSLSPQSRASLAAYFGFTPLQTFKKLTTFFKTLGVLAVLDTSCSRDLSLLETCHEFKERMTRSRQSEASSSSQALPMLTSACPGWICYAEKSHGSYVLPYISSAKSPQQAMGAVLKRFLWKNMNISPERIFHVCVMPCYDKKLEASRDDFLFVPQSETVDKTQQPVPEVDCVLTSGEILGLLQTQSVNFTALKESPLDRIFSNVDEEGHLYGASGGGSGGYAETVFKFSARELFGKVLEGPLEFKPLRNSDFAELSLEVNGEKVLNFARAYGFRNIQNLVRKIKTGRCQYHFVEIMACPSGCLNGGGQIKPKNGLSAKEQLQEVEFLYSNEVRTSDPESNPIVKALYRDWLGGPYSQKSIEILHTGYHLRNKIIGTQISNW